MFIQLTENSAQLKSEPTLVTYQMCCTFDLAVRHIYWQCRFTNCLCKSWFRLLSCHAMFFLLQWIECNFFIIYHLLIHSLLFLHLVLLILLVNKFQFLVNILNSLHKILAALSQFSLHLVAAGQVVAYDRFVTRFECGLTIFLFDNNFVSFYHSLLSDFQFLCVFYSWNLLHSLLIKTS